MGIEEVIAIFQWFLGPLLISAAGVSIGVFIGET